MKSTIYQVYKKQQLARAASQKIVRKRLRWFAIAISAVAVLVATTVAFALTPANGGLVGGTTIVVNNSPGNHNDPHVSGNLATYTDSSNVHYYDFLTTDDAVVPAGVPGELDLLSNVNGSKIAFSRSRVDGSVACMVYDTGTHVMTEIAPGGFHRRWEPVLGGNQIAFTELNSGNDEHIMVYDLSTNGPLVNLSMSPGRDFGPSLSPSGDAVVWQHCIGSNGSNCGILRSVRTGGGWSAAETIVDTSNEFNPDTDGTTVVYNSDRGTGLKIYFQPLLGGPETQLDMPGEQFYPSISSGVIAFDSLVEPGTGFAVFVYVIATNTLFQVTDTPTVPKGLNDISVLPNGDVRVVWATDAGQGNVNIQARTFSIPLGGDTTPPTVTITTPADGATYIMGQSVAADFSCLDATGGSGLASYTSPVINGNPIDTATVGSHSFSVTATDNAGNSATATNTYNVVYNFNGFFPPVDNLPTLNIATAGSAIPVKFSLGGDQSLAIFAAGYPASSPIQCDLSDPSAVIEETVSAGGSSLSYNATNDQYSYVWKTDKTWKGTCRMLVVKFSDGTQHLAKFRFR